MWAPPYLKTTRLVNVLEKILGSCGLCDFVVIDGMVVLLRVFLTM